MNGKRIIVPSRAFNLPPYYGSGPFTIIYLFIGAGSGADTQVHPDLIESARSVDNLTLVVGGGIRTPEQAKLAAEAGADWIVTGTLTEDAADLQELRQRISEITSALEN